MNKRQAQSHIKQLTLPIVGPVCHFKGCTEPVVGSSLSKSDANVCRLHNETEWAGALARGKNSYWRTFGKRWLGELQGSEP